MARAALDHLADVLEAIAKVREYTRGGEAAFRKTSMVRDAVIARFIQIGQAVKDAQDEGLDLAALAPEIAWRDVAGMRDRLAHKYWDADYAMIWSVIGADLEKLERAVRAIASTQGKKASTHRKGPVAKPRGARHR